MRDADRARRDAEAEAEREAEAGRARSVLQQALDAKTGHGRVEPDMGGILELPPVDYGPTEVWPPTSNSSNSSNPTPRDEPGGMNLAALREGPPFSDFARQVHDQSARYCDRPPAFKDKTEKSRKFEDAYRADSPPRFNRDRDDGPPTFKAVKGGFQGGQFDDGPPKYKGGFQGEFDSPPQFNARPASSGARQNNSFLYALEPPPDLDGSQSTGSNL